MTRHRFECISAFLHVVTAVEEAEHLDNPLCKILPLYNQMKEKRVKLYQPRRELSIDERIVPSKFRTHLGNM